MDINKLKDRLRKYRKKDIILTEHAFEQSIRRSISFEDIRDNIINPQRLEKAIRQASSIKSEEKYDCFFGYSQMHAHRYILALSKKCVVCTVIQINRRWK